MSFYFFLVFDCQAQMLNPGAEMNMDYQMQAFENSAGFVAPESGKGALNVVAVVIQAFLGFLGIIFVVLMIYGGYLWMTSRGNEEQVNKAKDTIRRAVIGLIIILSAYAITYTVFNSLPFKGGAGGGASGVTDL